MIIGFPNHPRKDIVEEIKWIGENDFAFVDVFLEPDECSIENISSKEIVKVCNDYNLYTLGHTAAYLPIGSPFKKLRKSVVDILKGYFDFFSG